jgi:hypothetical protein
MVHGKIFIAKMTALAVLAVVMSACNGGSGDDDKAAFITQLFTDDVSVRRGDDIDLTAEFTFSTEIVQEDNRNVILIVHVPNGLQYVPTTARIDEVGGHENVTPTIETCGGGDTYLRFNLGESDLEHASDPSGNANAELKLALSGTNAVGGVSIDAAAEYDALTGSCSAGLIPEDTTAVTVVP